ncbi:hypothetical protein L218DRAFT_947969 [Marasmius fiardii PR-910]|nr:hypothetical protein L218DRAFT_947969 [Marasmius fiardii PR-910]
MLTRKWQSQAGLPTFICTPRAMGKLVGKSFLHPHLNLVVSTWYLLIRDSCQKLGLRTPAFTRQPDLSERVNREAGEELRLKIVQFLHLLERMVSVKEWPPVHHMYSFSCGDVSITIDGRKTTKNPQIRLLDAFFLEVITENFKGSFKEECSGHSRVSTGNSLIYIHVVVLNNGKMRGSKRSALGSLTNTKEVPQWEIKIEQFIQESKATYCMTATARGINFAGKKGGVTKPTDLESAHTRVIA